MIEDMNKYNYKCYWIKYNHQKRKSGILVSIIKCYLILKKIKPDIVHSHLFDDSIVSMISAKLLGVKRRIVTKGDTGFHYFYKPQWVIFDRLINYLATDIVSISNESKRFIIEKENANPLKIKTIHHGLDIRKATNQKNEIKNVLKNKYKLEGKIVVGTISRFIKWKGYKQIVGAVKILKEQYDNLIFLFIGVGEQKSEIENLVKSENLQSNIIFTDWIPSDNIPSIIGVMDIFLHAAENEPFGLVVAEAMLNGIPVVSTKTGASLDSIEHMKSGYLCNSNMPSELAMGVRYIIEQNIENKIGLDGKLQAEKMFSIDLMYKNHYELYITNRRK